ncbi:ArsR family transcriptional regulator [Hydrocarboniphaga effusa]|uniref:VpaChn25_0724 family phage protein n=1 Tax=Hydrocarboniphaga effusa TaxID=243629 RepID=UPI003BAD267D
MSFLDVVIAEARLRMLVMLDENTADGSAHAGLLDNALDACGLSLSRDVVHSQLDWLAEQRLVDVSTVAGIKRATITQRGKDVARGQAIVTGVLRRIDLV